MEGCPTMDKKFVSQVASHFAFEGTFSEMRELTAGIINVTYLVTCTAADETSHDYVLQRINTTAFKDPVSLMKNIGKVTGFIRNSLLAEGVDPARRVLTFVEADNGTLLYTDPLGGSWRAYHYVDGVTAYNSIEDPAHFYEAGKGFGEFQTRLAAFPAKELTETIPHFHDTPHRYSAFLEAVEKDAVGRVAELGAEIAFLKEREALMGAIVSKLSSGELPLRVTHNDTKLNNVLVDDTTGKALCVIDLDTVMPGSSLYDYGDAVRYGACTSAEDEPDTGKVGFDMNLFEMFTRGFVEATKAVLTETEIRMLPVGTAVLTLELAIRFLTDYINGDVYFKTAYPGHNLVRARTQMRLLTEVEARMDDMNAFVDGLLE